MNIKEIGSAIISPANASTQTVKGSSSLQKNGFDTYLKQALGEVNQLQAKAGQAINELVGEGKGDLQETIIALQKADVSFRLMMQIRNKVMEAYEAIIRMQI